MRGFKNKDLNSFVKESIFNDLINFIFISLDNMKQVQIFKNEKIKNNEEKIRTHLVENYLNDYEFKNRIGYGTLMLKFDIEVPENYKIDEEKHLGRMDIRVITPNIFSNPKDYYNIECKRIDGSKTLNELFVKEGICRFVLEDSKYLSYHNKNIMLAFVVKNINIEQNVKQINQIQNDNKDIKMIQELQRNHMSKKQYYLYESRYAKENQQLELSHMFYDLSEIVRVK